MTNRCPNPECPDIILFGVVGEYGSSVTVCQKCGETLIEVESSASPPGDHDESGFVEPKRSGPYCYVASFRDWGPAQLARSFLVSCGFHAELLEENIVGLNWTYSQAVFGLKLVVSGLDGDEARDLLGENRSTDLLDIPEAALPATPYDCCPECGSEDIAWPKLERRCRALSMFFLFLVLMTPVAAHFQPTRCRDCRHRWFPQWDTGPREEENPGHGDQPRCGVDRDG